MQLLHSYPNKEFRAIETLKPSNNTNKSLGRLLKTEKREKIPHDKNRWMGIIMLSSIKIGELRIGSQGRHLETENCIKIGEIQRKTSANK